MSGGPSGGFCFAKSGISRAQLDWDEKGLPRSVQFNDKYFCQENGYRESIHVFCGGNHLGERFEKMDASDGKTFVIGETGFGTGLNFLSAWQLFDQSAPKDAKLHFVSLDQFPLSPDDLRKALKLWPELEIYSQLLTAQYADITADQFQISFQEGRVTLTLVFDHVVSALEKMRQDFRVWRSASLQSPVLAQRTNQYASLRSSTAPRISSKHESPVCADQFQMDAWFLDGFDPAKNPDMWAPEVFQAIACLSDSGTTVATFTSAGFVRRSLMEAGFNMERAKGFGRKRHMLKGVFQPKKPALGNDG